MERWLLLGLLVLTQVFICHTQEWSTVISSLEGNLAASGFDMDNLESLICGSEGTLLRSHDQGTIQWSKRNVIPFSRVRLTARVAFLDTWNGESLWIQINNQEVWRAQSSWRNHGQPTCLASYSDRFENVVVDLNVTAGTSSLDITVSSNLQSGVKEASFGLTAFVVQVVPSGSVNVAEEQCAYLVENDLWYSIKSDPWKTDREGVTLECANRVRIPCIEWFNSYTCHVPSGSTCPAPRSLYYFVQPAISSQSSASSAPVSREPRQEKCCSLGKSCEKMVMDPSASIVMPAAVSEQETCEYLYNKPDEDPTFVDIRVKDMTKTVKVQCGNGRIFSCVSSIWGKYTCTFKRGNRTSNNLALALCPEPRNALVNGQCCNLGKGCSSAFQTNTVDFDSEVQSHNYEYSSTTDLIMPIAAVCGVVAILAVLVGAVITNRHAESLSKMERVP